jgi:decaprenylphospho-beta-D-ribofuranose 2-oxidase
MRYRHLFSYSGLDSADARVFEPKTTEELQQLLQSIQAEKRRVTFRGGGYSFDAQSLNEDTVIMLNHFQSIKSIEPEKRQITVEPGVRWKDILRALRPHGLTPQIVVTNGQVTAGGTLCADCYSRSSSKYGKEGCHIARFRLLMVDGKYVECSPTENQELFSAVIGGFGYLGVVTEITYNLLPIGDKTQVETAINKYTSFEGLVDGLQQYLRDLENWDAVYAIAFFSGKGEKGFVLRSRYSSNKRFKRLFIYQKSNWLRILFEWVIRVSWINTLILNLGFQFFVRDNETYLDDLESYTFFMESNRRSKAIARRFGIQLPVIQQTFIVPKLHLLAFLHDLATRLRSKRLNPSLFDIVPIPSDDMLMSASRALDGFAVSVAFEDLDTRTILELHRQLQAASAQCAKLGGRVHLVKNVYATPEHLYEMYTVDMEHFLRLKEQVDPEGLLHNSFFERVFQYGRSHLQGLVSPES